MDRERDMDRDRDRDRDRDHRRDRFSNSWSNNSDWSRRRNGAHFPRDRDFGGHYNKRYSNDRGRDEEQEPEWFSGKFISQSHPMFAFL